MSYVLSLEDTENIFYFFQKQTIQKMSHIFPVYNTRSRLLSLFPLFMNAYIKCSCNCNGTRNSILVRKRWPDAYLYKENFTQLEILMHNINYDGLVDCRECFPCNMRRNLSLLTRQIDNSLYEGIILNTAKYIIYKTKDICLCYKTVCKNSCEPYRFYKELEKLL